MISNFKAKIEESLISVVPVMLVVIALHFSISPLQPGQLPLFIVSGGMVILGLGVFLLGADLGMVPFGQRVGSALAHKQSITLILIASFSIGFAITIAEPDVQVLATQVHGVAPTVDKNQLLIMIAVGVGLFLLVGTVRTVLGWPLRWLLILFYLLVFIFCAFVDAGFVGVAFDAGGATTGPVTVPFIMAMGLGVAAATKKKEGEDNSFGLVGLASIGPIAAVAFMGFLSNTSLSAGEYHAEAYVQMPVLDRCLELLPPVAEEIFLALFPLLLIFLFFQVVLLKLPAHQVKRMITGLVYSYIGLVIFMLGVKSGFMMAGQSLGNALGAIGDGGVLIPIGVLFGAVVVCAEPAVWVLTKQVEEVSGGHIKRFIMLVALSISIAMAVGVGMTRVVFGFSIWWVLIPGYALALVLTKFCPPLFTGIAFDSGGVASGPMSTTFVLSMTLGGAVACGGNPATDGFGMVAMIALAPLITIQVLGLIFKFKEKQAMRRENERGAA